MDPELYRRRQRRRAAIGWTALLALVALVVVGIEVGGGGGDDRTGEVPDLGSLSVRAEMSAGDYESIRNGEGESALLGRLGSGLSEGEVDQGLLSLFPAQPGGSHCAFWSLSDAPGHLVRLCFHDEREALVQKSVAAKGEGAAPKSLV